MVAKQFEVELRHRPDVAILDLHGEIDAFSEEDLNAAYAEADRQSPKTLVLNFTDVNYINSTGIALIVGILAQARKARRRLMVYGLSDHYEEIFTITRLADFMDVYEDEDSALAAATDGA